MKSMNKTVLLLLGIIPRSQKPGSLVPGTKLLIIQYITILNGFMN